MLKHEHLLGREFDWYNAHCYTLMRDFYRDNFEVELPDVACPKEWWLHGLDLYGQLYHYAGFVPVDCHPRDYRPGDLILMAYQSPVANHLGVLLDNGKMLHHMVGGLSSADPYSAGGFWKSQTVGVLRHRDVNYQPPVTKLDMWSLLPDHVREPLDQQLADFEARGIPTRGD